MIGLGGIFISVMTNSRRPRFIVLPGFKATSCLTVVLLICLETVLLSTVSNCAKTFYMHWNTTNSIFRIDNTDHIIDVNKGNLPFEYDQVHIICPVYEPGTFENETEKYIIYNVSKVEYETCRITNANPRIIAICDKPQRLMFFTITFRPFTPQPGGLEFLAGHDYYFISTSSKEDLHRRIGGRCSTNNMKVVFKVCCTPEEQQMNVTSLVNSNNNNNNNINNNNNNNHNNNQQHQATSGVSINTNIERTNNNNNQQQQQNSPNGGDLNSSSSSPSNGGSGGGGNTQIGNGIGTATGNDRRIIPPMINTNTSNIVQSTMSWPGGWGGGGGGGNGNTQIASTTSSVQFYPHMTSMRPNINSAINSNNNNNNNNNHNNNNSNFNNNNSNLSPSHKPTKKTNEYDKHPNEVVKNEELTYNNNSSGGCHYKLARTSLNWWRQFMTLLTIAVLVILLNNYKEHLQIVTINERWWCQR